MKKNWLSYLLAYGMWFVFLLLGILFMVMSRNGLTGLLNTFYLQPDLPHDFDRRMQIALFDRVYFLVVAFVLLILVIVVEEYFKRGIGQGQMMKRFAKVFGIEVLFLFAASFITAYMVGFSPLVWLVLAGELILGVLLIGFSIKKSGRVQPGTIENLFQ